MTTHIVLVMDRSGSMAAIAANMEQAINRFVKDQQAVPGDCRFTFAQFDMDYELVHDGVDINEVGSITLHPRGTTALLDAVGLTIARLEEGKPAEKTIFCIVTDGEENASREYKLPQIRDMVHKHDDWEFVFLGANVDAFVEADRIGIVTTKASSWADDPIGIYHTLRNLSTNVSLYRQNISTSMDWTNKQRAENESRRK